MKQYGRRRCADSTEINGRWTGYAIGMLAAGITIDGKYEIVRVLGQGAFGQVVLAKQAAFDRLVAVKIMRQEIVDAETQARFEREAKLLSMLSHPNIAVFLGFGVWRQCMYTVMEYVAGETLTDAVHRTSMKPQRAFQITRQILSALGHAHAHGVVHRDLKPENVLLDSKTQKIKIIDFGLAHFDDRPQDQRLTQDGDAMGSVLYMPPEQCEGRTADARSDLYSVGCILYFMLTGEPVYISDSHVGVMMQHIRSPIPKIDAEKQNPLDDFLSKFLAKNPGDRFQSVDEALAELTVLEQNQANLPTPAQKLSATLSSAQHHMRYRRLIRAGVILGAIVLVAGSIAVYCSGSLFLQDSVAQLPALEAAFTSAVRKGEHTNAARMAMRIAALPGASDSVQREWNAKASSEGLIAVCDLIAHEHWDEGFALVQELPPSFELINPLSNIVAHYQFTNQYEKAGAAGTVALGLFSHFPQVHADTVPLEIPIAEGYYSAQKWDKAIEVLQSLHRRLVRASVQSTTTDKYLAAIDLLWGQALFKKQLYPESKKILEESAIYYKRLKEYGDEAKTESLRGTLWQADMESKNFEDALMLANETLGLAETHKNSRMQAQWLRHEAIALWSLNRRDEARKTLEKEIALADASGDYSEQYAARVFLAMQTREFRDQSGAIGLLSDAMKIAEAHPTISYPGPPSVEETRQTLRKWEQASPK